jgi:hypothetical protein
LNQNDRLADFRFRGGDGRGNNAKRQKYGERAHRFYPSLFAKSVSVASLGDAGLILSRRQAHRTRMRISPRNCAGLYFSRRALPAQTGTPVLDKARRDLDMLCCGFTAKRCQRIVSPHWQGLSLFNVACGVNAHTRGILPNTGFSIKARNLRRS